MSHARPAAGVESCRAGFCFIVFQTIKKLRSHCGGMESCRMRDPRASVYSKERNKAMYNKVDTNLNFMEREKNVEQFWRDNDIFKKSMEQRKQGPTYTFYDGPPTANGKPHIGHLETRVIKDMIPRYRTMKGYYVPRKAGWDTHGLPVELEVEKLLGLDGKDQIEQYGLVPFIDKCKESVWKYKGMWEKFSDTVGFWADMDNPYITYDDNYIESEWWALKQIWDKKPVIQRL